MVRVYTSPHKVNYTVPELDCWDGLLGNTSRRISDDKVFVVDAVTGESTTYGAARTLAKQIAYGIRTTAGLKEGDVIGIFSPNSALYPVLAMAAQCASVTASLANSSYGLRELCHQLKDSQVSLLFASAELLDTAKKGMQEAGLDSGNLYVLPGLDGKTPDGVKGYRELVQPGKEWKHVPLAKDKLRNVPAYLPYSSGTTGLPKGVVVSHYNVMSMGEQLAQTGVADKATVSLATLPCFHIYALSVNIHLTIRVGGTLVVIPKFDLELFLSTIQKYKCTLVPIVPPIALALARHPVVDKYDLSSIRELVVGAAPCSKEIISRVQKRLNCTIHQGLGMTETTAVSNLNRAGMNIVGSVGPLVPGQEARIVNDEGQDSEQGELWLRGGNIVTRYHRNEKSSRDTFTSDGWLKTGDVGYFKDGYLYIVDRTKELIKYKGFQVAPAELEAVLLDCDLVDDAAVIGVYSENDATELPRAYVVASAKAKKDEDAASKIQKYVADNCAQHKRLRGGVFFIETIPKTTSGKILRKDLRAMAAKEQKSTAKL